MKLHSTRVLFRAFAQYVVLISNRFHTALASLWPGLPSRGLSPIVYGHGAELPQPAGVHPYPLLPFSGIFRSARIPALADKGAVAQAFSRKDAVLLVSRLYHSLNR